MISSRLSGLLLSLCTVASLPAADLTPASVTDFESLQKLAAQLALQPYQAPSQQLDPFFEGLKYDGHRQIRFREDKALFKGNLSWKFADRGLLYATVSQGYRRGGSNAVPTIGRYAEDPSWQQYKSDTLINYEVGVKGALGGLTYNLDAFYIDWKDIQLNTATPVSAICASMASSQRTSRESSEMSRLRPRIAFS